MRKQDNGGYHVLVYIRDNQFSPVETLTFSGKDAIIDLIYHLDKKYNPPPLAYLKKFW